MSAAPIDIPQLLTATRSARKSLDLDAPVDLAAVRDCLRIGLHAANGRTDDDGTATERLVALIDAPDRHDVSPVAGLHGLEKVPSFLWQSPEEVVRAGLDGLARGKVVVVPGALNRTVALAFSLVPTGVKRRTAGVVQRRSEEGGFAE